MTQCILCHRPLSAFTGLATFEATGPIVAPVGGFEADKIYSNHKKLKIVLHELMRRNLSKKRKKT
jgi:hypothetical protein